MANYYIIAKLNCVNLILFILLRTFCQDQEINGYYFTFNNNYGRSTQLRIVVDQSTEENDEH